MYKAKPLVKRAEEN